MRSWNFYFCLWIISFLPCSQFTNEELKPALFRISPLMLPMFAIYQWGVETWCFARKTYFYFFVRNLPMRSWNQYTSLSDIQRLSGSQFTNEELKLLFAFFSQFSSLMFAIYQWGVETLFRCSCLNDFFYVVRNLPMRSWNTSLLFQNPKNTHCSQFTNEELKRYRKVQFFWGLRLFAIYQWGVETWKINNNWKFHHKFAIYQWGVETY